MTKYQKISLLLAVLTALFLMGIAISIAEYSIWGILIFTFCAVMTPGIGFMIRKRLQQ